MRRKSLLIAAAGIIAWSWSVLPAQAQQAPAEGAKPASPPPKSPFEAMTDKMKKVEGMWTLYYKDQQLLAEISPSSVGQNFMVNTSIAKGISHRFVLGGMTWGFGDDVIWSFAKVGDKLHVLRRNVRFKAAAGSPEANAVKLAYNDSILYALPILTTGPSGGMLVDMTRIFMSDDQQIGRSIGMSFAPDRSTWAKVKAFPENVELQVAAVYVGGAEIDTVADTRGAQINVHYSISRLKPGDYRPRVADDRIGYFLTVIKDFSDKKDDEQFVRYINRWNLQKESPGSQLSQPKKPIRFYMEKTVPLHLRPHVRAGIEEWNKAFAKLGYSNAIEVEQQRDEDDWDPEDVRFNTFRWITANAGFAMGPSRVDPTSGQILDADIIFDADFLTAWKHQYETFTPGETTTLLSSTIDPQMQPFGKLLLQEQAQEHAHSPREACAYCLGMQQQMGFATAALVARGDLAATKGGLPDELVAQALKEVVMHEVGHTLGLRHNFKASTWKTLGDIDDPVKGAAEGTVGSVMDYTPINIAPKGTKQGLYYPTTIGPYDYWAIEYGYKSIAGDEAAELKKIAARGAEAGLDYATDEDIRDELRGTFFIDSDPLVNRFDLGKDPLEFARRQMKTSSELWAKVVERAVPEGEGYQRARQAFGMLLSEYWRTLLFVSRYPGGIYVHRDHKGDPNGRPPFKPVEAAKQREAMKILTESAFNLPPLPPPDVLNALISTRWSHWGIREPRRLDFAVHDTLTLIQGQIVLQLLATPTLLRLHDSEVKQAPDADVYTLAEHLRTLVDGVFTELRSPPKAGEYTNRNAFISSSRRELQRVTLRELVGVLEAAPPRMLYRVFFRLTRGVPEDARTLTRLHLSDLDKQITTLLSAPDVKLDDYTRAHVLDMQERIRKVLQTQLVTPTVD